MRKTLRWLLGNLGLIVLSLALAVLVWVAAVEQGDPTSEQRYLTAVALTVPAPPEGMIAYGQTATQVYVTLRAPESVWRSLQPTDIHATVSLNGLTPGTHRLSVQVQVDQQPVLVRGVEPEAITIILEPVERSVVPVRVHVEGSAALGYIVRSPVVSPLTVTVQGPASLVSQTAEAVTLVNVEGGRANVEGQFDLTPRSADGTPVSDVTLEPDHAAVYVSIDKLSGFRDVAVIAALDNVQVAPGYRIAGVTVDPPVVTVFGDPEVIAQIPGYLETTPLEMENVQADVEERLPLVAPDGVSLLMDEPIVNVRITVLPVQGSLTLRLPVEVQGMASEMTATVAPDTVDVILAGPLPVLEQLQEKDVRVIVDLFGLTAGSYSLAPQAVVAPLQVVAESILPASVQVEIKPGSQFHPR